MYDISYKVVFLGKEEWLKFYGSSTVGERGQVVLPASARKRYKIEAGEKLIVMGFDTRNFERIVLMKPEAITGMLRHIMDIENFFKQGGTKAVEKMLKEGMQKTKKAEKIVKKR